MQRFVSGLSHVKRMLETHVHAFKYCCWRSVGVCVVAVCSCPSRASIPSKAAAPRASVGTVNPCLGRRRVPVLKRCVHVSLLLARAEYCTLCLVAVLCHCTCGQPTQFEGAQVQCQSASGSHVLRFVRARTVIKASK